MNTFLLKINTSQIGILVLLTIGMILIILSEVNYVSYDKFLEYQKTLPPGHSSPFHQGLQFFYYQISAGIIIFASGVFLLIKTQEKHRKKEILLIGIATIALTLFIMMTAEQISYSNAIINLKGLKNTYKIGEEVEFFIQINTTDHICIPLRVVIEHVNSSKILWSNDKSFFDDLSCFTDGIDVDLSYGTKENPIIINETGSYVVHIDSPNQIIKKFSIIE